MTSLIWLWNFTHCWHLEGLQKTSNVSDQLLMIIAEFDIVYPLQQNSISLSTTRCKGSISRPSRPTRNPLTSPLFNWRHSWTHGIMNDMPLSLSPMIWSLRCILNSVRAHSDMPKGTAVIISDGWRRARSEQKPFEALRVWYWGE